MQKCKTEGNTKLCFRVSCIKTKAAQSATKRVVWTFNISVFIWYTLGSLYFYQHVVPCVFKRVLLIFLHYNQRKTPELKLCDADFGGLQRWISLYLCILSHLTPLRSLMHTRVQLWFLCSEHCRPPFPDSSEINTDIFDQSCLNTAVLKCPLCCWGLSD